MLVDETAPCGAGCIGLADACHAWSVHSPTLCLAVPLTHCLPAPAVRGQYPRSKSGPHPGLLDSLVSWCPLRTASRPRPYVGNTRVINRGHTPAYWIRRLGGNTRPTMPAWSARDWRHTPVPHALTPLRRVLKGYTLGGPWYTPRGAPAPPPAFGLRLILNRLVPFHGWGSER